MPADTITVRRELLERLIIEIDALTSLETIRNGGQETPIVDRIYRLLGEFEHRAFGDQLTEERSNEMHWAAIVRGRELAREWMTRWLEDDRARTEENESVHAC